MGTVSNRSAIGGRVRGVAGDLIQYQEINSGNSYLSCSDLRLHFGLDDAERVDVLGTRWPGGKIDKSSNLEVNQRCIMAEGQGYGYTLSRKVKAKSWGGRLSLSSNRRFRR